MNKSEIVVIGADGDGNRFARVLGCKVVCLTIKYLGVSLGASFKDGKSWKLVVNLFERKLAGWKRNFLSKGGRLT